MMWWSAVWRRLPLMAACGLVGCAGLVPSGPGSTLTALHSSLNANPSTSTAAAANVPSSIADAASQAADPPVLPNQLRAKGLGPIAAAPSPDLPETLDPVEIEEVADTDTPAPAPPAAAGSPPIETSGRAPRVEQLPLSGPASREGLVIPPPPPALAGGSCEKSEEETKPVSPREFDRQLAGAAELEAIELVEEERLERGEPVELVDEDGNACAPETHEPVTGTTDLVAGKSPKSAPSALLAPGDPLDGTRVAGDGSLDIRVLELCRQVSGFGRIEVAPDASLGPGRAMLAYAEIDNFPVEAEGDHFVTRLAARMVLETPTGAVVEQWEFGDIVDHCRTRRKDFFCHFTVTLPETLTPGTYVLRLKVRDPRGGGLAERTRELSISTPVLAKGR